MVLHILAIIGIVLLCIVAFVILILLLLLLVPFRYKITANGKDAEIEAFAGVRWLLGFVRVIVSYKQSKVTYKVKVLFLSILKGEIGGSADEKEAPRELTQKEIKKERKKEEKAKKKQAAKEEKARDKQAKKDKKKEEKALEKKTKKEEEAKLKEPGIKGKIVSIAEKIKKTKGKLEKVKYIWDAPVTKRALAFLKEIIFKLFGHLLPKKLTGRVKYNLSDPNTMAQIYAIASILLGAMGAELILEPDFDNEGIVIENVNVKGRIFVGYMVLLGLKVLMNKDVKRVIKYIRRNL